MKIGVFQLYRSAATQPVVPLNEPPFVSERRTPVWSLQFCRSARMRFVFAGLTRHWNPSAPRICAHVGGAGPGLGGPVSLAPPRGLLRLARAPRSPRPVEDRWEGQFKRFLPRPPREQEEPAVFAQVDAARARGVQPH